jgi:hypothetical protein
VPIARACIVGDRHCSDGGRALPGTSRCRNHTRSNWGSYRPEHAPVYRTRQWTDLRARVLREQPVCDQDGCIARSTAVDHIVPLSRGGPPMTAQTFVACVPITTVSAARSRALRQVGGSVRNQDLNRSGVNVTLRESLQLTHGTKADEAISLTRCQ